MPKAKTATLDDSTSTLSAFFAFTIVAALTLLVVAATVRLALLILGVTI